MAGDNSHLRQTKRQRNNKLWLPNASWLTLVGGHGIARKGMGIRNVPPAHLTACYYCGTTLDTRDITVYQFLSGWARNKNQGNSVTLGKREYKYACGECIDRLRHNISIGQQGLWDNA
jgi:hypothetical protein